MTRSITIVNTSNWQNEDYEIEVIGQEKRLLQPGESMQFTPASGLTDQALQTGICEPVAIRKVGIIEPQPFRVPVGGVRRKDRPVVPKVSVTFE